MADSIVVTGTGLRCSVGNGVAQAAAVVRARVSRFASWLHGSVGPGEEPVVVAALSPSPPPTPWTQFALLQAPQPLHEALWQARVYDGRELAQKRKKLGLYLAAPAETRLALENQAELATFREVGVRDCFEVLTPEATRVEFVTLGNAAGCVAIARACEALRQRELDVAVVGAIDTHLDGAWLERLLAARRLKAGDASGGLIPGEAAAFVVLERENDARARGAEPLGRIGGAVVAEEPVPIGAEHPLRAEAFSSVMAELLAAHADGASVRHVWTDVNGERWRSLEWALVETRTLGGLPPRGWTQWTPAETLGDIGAATALAHACIALQWPRRAFAVGETHVIGCASFEGARGVLLIEPLAAAEPR